MIILKIPNIKESWLEQEVKSILFENSEHYDLNTEYLLALEKVIDDLDGKDDKQLDKLALENSEHTFDRWLEYNLENLKNQWKSELLQELTNTEVEKYY
ncbi:hypothetical protein [Mycoplasma putrefaciens]|nr:hypothetical protein [Mycoplasma putrefaciens]